MAWIDCPECGKPTTDHSPICTHCGESIVDEKDQPEQTDHTKEVMSDITSHTKNTPSNDSEFKAGQLVQLKSGGPVMTVKGSPYSRHWDDWEARSLYLIPRAGDCVNYFFNTDITCQWFDDGGDAHEDSFPHTSLVPFRADTDS